MFTGVSHKNLSAAKSYFREHFSGNDYYSEGEIHPGRWLGNGAAALGLEEGSQVNQKDFIQLCEARNPSTSQSLTQRQNADGERRVLFDFTCSAPKSVSLMASTMEDNRLMIAHQESARIAFKELERFAATRVRKDGANTDRQTGILIAAEFIHDASRALDPQIHTHFPTFNFTYDPVEKRWKALQTSDMFDAIKYATLVYQNEMCSRLATLGYETISTPKGFEIKGVPQPLLEAFSKRSSERDVAVLDQEKKLGRKLTKNEISVVVHKTRSPKLREMTPENVRAFQLKQMTPEEIDLLQKLKAQAKHPLPSSPDQAAEKLALDFAVEHAFERASVVPEEELLSLALLHGRGKLRLDLLKEGLKDAHFVRHNGKISTKSILKQDRLLISMVDAGQANFSPLAFNYLPKSSLGRDQREAVTHVLRSSDQVTGFRGLAGAGKTTALQAIHSALKENNHSSLFCAPNTAAVDVLRKDGHSEAITLQRLLVDQQQQQKLAPGSIIVVDEAGRMGTVEMLGLMTLVRDKNLRVILSGDTGQHASVTRGDALRTLEKHSSYRSSQLKEIRRQHSAEYRNIVRLAADGKPQESFDRLDKNDNVHEVTNPFEKAAEAFLAARAQGHTSLLIAPSWKEIDPTNAAVRSRLKAQGDLHGEEQVIPVFESLRWTNAQKRHFGQYKPGQRLHFHKTSGRIKKNEELQVITSSSKGLEVRRRNGETFHFFPKSGSSFDVGEERRIAITNGDTLLLQANRSQQRLINGQIVRVKNIQSGRITLDDGRTLPADYRHFSHGYCVTSHASQSKTVDSVFLVSTASSGAAANAQQFYVSISRGRKVCKIFTDNKDLLRSRLSKSSQRQSALELLSEALRKTSPPPHPKLPQPITKKGRFRVFQNLPSLSKLHPSSIFQLFSKAPEEIRQSFAFLPPKISALRHKPSSTPPSEPMPDKFHTTQNQQPTHNRLL